MSSQIFGGVFQNLLEAKEIESCQFARGDSKANGSLRIYAGFRVIDPASRLKANLTDSTDSTD